MWRPKDWENPYRHRDYPTTRPIGQQWRDMPYAIAEENVAHKAFEVGADTMLKVISERFAKFVKDYQETSVVDDKYKQVFDEPEFPNYIPSGMDMYGSCD